MSFFKYIPGRKDGAGPDKAAIGREGEREAERALKRNGYVILDRNFRCRQGEIDIIAREGETLIFVEVKTRGSDSFGTPKCSVDSRKQRRIILAAQAYMNLKGITDCDVRFDVVSIEIKGGRLNTEVLKGAFDAVE